MSATVVKHRDEFEVMPGSGGCTWMLARKALGTEGFGYNLVELAGTFASIGPASSRTILNRSEGPVTALLIGVVPATDYKPPGWA